MDSIEKMISSPAQNSSPVIIVGAGPSGLATAAALKMKGISSIIIEKEDCIGSLWKKKTYDRLHFHIPKKFCSLPHFKFPSHVPEYPSRIEVVEYLDEYSKNFQLHPLLNHTVVNSFYDEVMGAWKVFVVDARKPECLLEFVAKWLVVASGENCEPVLPLVPGIADFKGPVLHSSQYKNGSGYVDKRVLVVGSGNSGMEIALDLANHGAHPFLAVRGKVHVLPRDIFCVSTFSITTTLLRLGFPIWFIDGIFLLYSWALYGDLSKLGFSRPKEGPMEVKLKVGQTPVLDVGTLAEIKSGHIKVMPGVTSFSELGATFENDQNMHFDAIIMATGYRSNVCKWLQGGGDFFDVSGHPKEAFPGGWKGQTGLFAAGLTRRGFQGACHDAEEIADYIHNHQSK